jgi:hypothetical protein
MLKAFRPTNAQTFAAATIKGTRKKKRTRKKVDGRRWRDYIYSGNKERQYLETVGNTGKLHWNQGSQRKVVLEEGENRKKKNNNNLHSCKQLPNNPQITTINKLLRDFTVKLSINYSSITRLKYSIRKSSHLSSLAPPFLHRCRIFLWCNFTTLSVSQDHNV